MPSSAGGTAGTATIGSTTTVSPASIAFNATGSGNYMITGGSISTNLGSGSSSLPVTVNQSATIASASRGLAG